MGLTLIFVLVNVLLIGANDQSDYLGLKDAVGDLQGQDAWAKATSIFGALLDGALSPQLNTTQELLYSLLLLLTFLACIWAARQASAGHRPTIRQTLYNSPTPFISSLLVAVVLGVQLLPAAIGAYVINIAYTQGFLNDMAVGLVLGAFATLLTTLSLYWMITTVVGLVVVSLPNMYPLAAIGSAKQLVLGRRFNVLLRLVGLSLWLLALWTIVLLPFLVIDTTTNLEAVPFIPFALQMLGGLSVVVGSLYLYRLYRALL